MSLGYGQTRWHLATDRSFERLAWCFPGNVCTLRFEIGICALATPRKHNNSSTIMTYQSSSLEDLHDSSTSTPNPLYLIQDPLQIRIYIPSTSFPSARHSSE